MSRTPTIAGMWASGLSAGLAYGFVLGLSAGDLWLPSRSVRVRRNISLAAAIACVVCLLITGSAGAQGYRPQCSPPFPQFCGGVSANGSRVVFGFPEALTKGPERPQVYERSGGVTRALVPYPASPPDPTYAALLGLSEDAAHVFIWTNLDLAPAEDLDGTGGDVYDLHRGSATLISTSSSDPHAGAPVLPMSFIDSSADGTRAFLQAFSSFSPQDTDGCPDLYERAGGVTRLISTGPAATSVFPPNVCDLPEYGGLSDDSNHVFFSSGDHLISGDEGAYDIYQRVGDELSIVSDYPQEPASNCVDKPKFGDASADGRSVLFSTNAQISPEDQDTTYDVYRRGPDGGFTLISRGTDGGSQPCGFTGDRAVALSDDGAVAIFETTASLSPQDVDHSPDLYSEEAGAVALVTTGPTDTSRDEQVPVFPAWPADVSADAKSVAFETRQPLVVEDDDSSQDVYLHTPAGTELVSTGPLTGNGPQSAELIGLAADGDNVAFATEQRLTAEDTDDDRDFYLRRPKEDSVTGGARMSRAAGRMPRQRPSRTVLLSAESIPPRMTIGKRARVTHKGKLALHLGCPKAETSGPCQGRVRVTIGRRGRAVARGGLKVEAGRRLRVSVRLRASSPNLRGRAAFVHVRAADRLGNAASVVRRARIQGR